MYEFYRENTVVPMSQIGFIDFIGRIFFIPVFMRISNCVTNIKIQ